MMRSFYKLLFRATRIRGLNRLDGPLRNLPKPPVDRVGDLLMDLDIFETSQVDLMAGYIDEPGTLDLIERLLEPDDIWIDIGAHVGLHTLVAARKIGPGGRALAVDPQPYNCDRLLTNAALNNLTNILVICAAAGERDGFVVLPNQNRNDKTRLSLAGQSPGDTANMFEVPVVRIDALAARHEIASVKLMKIDVEGYEREVLAGGEKTLGVTQHLVFECLPDTDRSLIDEIRQQLTGRGFSFRQVDGSPWTVGRATVENNVWATRY